MLIALTFFNEKILKYRFAALVDSSYRFLVVDTAGFGKQADGGVFASSNLKKLLDRTLNVNGFLPSPKTLSGSNLLAPFVILADKAYPLRPDLLRPYGNSELTEPQKRFNAKHIATRKTIECAFGQLTSQFRLFRGKIELRTDHIINLTISVACLLHNIFIDCEDRVHAELRKDVNRKMSTKSNEIVNSESNFFENGDEVREIFTKHFQLVAR